MNLRLLYNGLLLLAIIGFLSCEDDDSSAEESGIRVTFENISEPKNNIETGPLFSGVLMPGAVTEQFSFRAGANHSLNFATMYVGSNDLFYAFPEGGLALFTTNGQPVVGDVTNALKLWDAGTEVNERPGRGSNQANQQMGPNTGATESNTVRLLESVSSDNFEYPPVERVLGVSLAYDEITSMFTVSVSNISQDYIFTRDTTIFRMDTMMVDTTIIIDSMEIDTNLTIINTVQIDTTVLDTVPPTPLSPGVWVVQREGTSSLFQLGQTASSALEALAEDGNRDAMLSEQMANTGFVTAFSPVGYSLNQALFAEGDTATLALTAMAEDGNASLLPNVGNIPNGETVPRPIGPGESYTIFLSGAESSDVVSMTSMFVESNDWFVGANNISLTPGDVTGQFQVYDAGTEEDEWAGTGNAQAPRQPSAGFGMDEGGLVQVEREPSANVPTTGDAENRRIDLSTMLRVTVSN